MSEPHPGECELSTYAEIVEVITNLRFLVRERRRRERLSMRAVADLTGLNASSIHRFENGKDVSTDNLLALVRWVGDIGGPS
jgi:hypothetical protein